MSFEDTQGNPISTVDLRQCAANEFLLLTRFCYVPADSSNSAILVDEGTRTDLASVPFWLWWFVASHGRHTLPAVLHDSLVRCSTSFDERSRADDLFLEALEDRKIGWFRRRIMWTAVTLATYWKYRRPTLAVMVLQILLGIAAAFVLSWHDFVWTWSVSDGSATLDTGKVGPLLPVVYPLVAAFLWRRRWPAVALGTYISPFLAPAVISVLATVVLTSVPNILRWAVSLLPFVDRPDGPIFVRPTKIPWP